MIVAVVWIVTFAVIAGLAWKNREGAFDKMVKRMVPTILRCDDSRTEHAIWAVVAGVLVATMMVRPASMLLTLILIALIALLVRTIIRFAMKKVH